MTSPPSHLFALNSFPGSEKVLLWSNSRSDSEEPKNKTDQKRITFGILVSPAVRQSAPHCALARQKNTFACRAGFSLSLSMVCSPSFTGPFFKTSFSCSNNLQLKTLLFKSALREPNVPNRRTGGISTTLTNILNERTFCSSQASYRPEKSQKPVLFRPLLGSFGLTFAPAYRPIRILHSEIFPSSDLPIFGNATLNQLNSTP